MPTTANSGEVCWGGMTITDLPEMAFRHYIELRKKAHNSPLIEKDKDWLIQYRDIVTEWVLLV